MADDQQPLRPDLADPSAHGLDQDRDLQRDEDEMLVSAIRRFGPIVLVLVIVLSVVLAYGANREQKQKEARIEGTRRLQEALTGFNENPSGTRKALQDLIAEGIYEGQPLKAWVEFFIVRTHVIEAQQKFAADGTPMDDVLPMIDTFIAANSRHKELSSMALLAKGAVLDDLGRYDEARQALDQASLNPEAIGGLFANELLRTAPDRQKVWEKYRNKTN